MGHDWRRFDCIDKVGGEITSWDQVFGYNGPVAWLDDPRAMIGIALQNPRLRPEYVRSRSGQRSARLPDQQRRQRRLHRGRRRSGATGAATWDITVEYMGDIYQVAADCGCDNIKFALPEEGGNIWVDNLAIPTGAPNKPLARFSVNYILDPQVGTDINNYTAYASPDQAAIDAGLIDPHTSTARSSTRRRKPSQPVLHSAAAGCRAVLQRCLGRDQDFAGAVAPFITKTLHGRGAARCAYAWSKVSVWHRSASNSRTSSRNSRRAAAK
ncbi:MAG: ABC transporter substrate-binding protein [Anaerolineae bacterium]